MILQSYSTLLTPKNITLVTRSHQKSSNLPSPSISTLHLNKFYILSLSYLPWLSLTPQKLFPTFHFPLQWIKKENFCQLFVYSFFPILLLLLPIGDKVNFLQQRKKSVAGKLVTLETRTVDLSTLFSSFLSHPQMKYKKFFLTSRFHCIGG